jgi:hypothetical protein
MLKAQGPALSSDKYIAHALYSEIVFSSYNLKKNAVLLQQKDLLQFVSPCFTMTWK